MSRVRPASPVLSLAGSPAPPLSLWEAPSITLSQGEELFPKGRATGDKPPALPGARDRGRAGTPALHDESTLISFNLFNK